MLCLHIGMPKTGTTALQGFMRQNSDSLDDMGLRYLEAGRRRPDGIGNLPISHNRLHFDLNRDQAAMDAYRRQINEEYAQHSDKLCLISSEALYSADHQSLATALADIPADQIRVIFYCRRYSDYFEAEYKQRAKNSRLGGEGMSFIKNRLKKIKDNPQDFNFSGKVNQLKAAYPTASIEPYLYERSELQNQNIVDDFFSRLGLTIPDGADRSGSSNPSLSRVASEAFGIVSRAIGRKDSRRLRRNIPNDPVMFRKHDVLEPGERAWLDEFLTKSDAEFHKTFFPERKTVFEPKELSEQESAFRRGSETELIDFHRACEIAFNMALKVSAKG